MDLDELGGLQQEKNQEQLIELKSWQGRFRRNRENKPIENSVFNIELILLNDNKLKDKLAFNEFTYEECLTGDLELNGVSVPGGFVEDNFTHALKSYIEQEYKFVPKPQNIESAIINVSRRNSFHPIKEYLEGAKKVWDGQKRIETLLADYLGVEQSEYSYKGFLCLLIGAIQKVYNPSEKFDFIFDLVGGQGSGKTTLLQKLFLDSKGYYTDSIRTFYKVDDITIMQRCWGVNDDEMEATKVTGIEVLKKFATQKTLEYRTPYARRNIRRPRNFVIVRTSNMIGHLKDETGNRRFVPFKARKEHQKHHPLEDGEYKFNAALVQQAWGEAMTIYQKLDRSKFYREVEVLAESYQEEFLAVDSIKEIVYAVLEVPVPYDFYEYNDDQRASYVQGYLSNNGNRYTIGTQTVNPDDTELRDRVRIKDISLEGFNEQLGKNNKRDNKIRIIMDNHKDWERKRNPSIKFGHRKERGYLKRRKV